MTNNKILWQDFTVTSGALARNPAGQLEGRLELAEGYVLTFLADATGSTVGWQPDEPVFEATRLEDPDDDADDVLLDPQVPGHMILVADGAAMVARCHPVGMSWQYVPADNWRDLADLARAEVERQGGGLNLSGLYHCPTILFDQGRWELPPALVDEEAL